MAEHDDEIPPRLHYDVRAGIALLLACGVGFWLTTHFPTVPAMLSQNIPPTFFPRLILGVIAIMSAALIVGGARKAPEAKEKLRVRVLVTAAVIVLATLLVVVLGTLITLFLVTLALPLVWGERRYVAIVLLAIALPIAIYVVFALALGVRFPAGPILALFA